ncbi:DsrE family protein [Plasticicumulans acidivorans]|uniref:Putative peroxiredoxin n=1 Tax=Plasticicumulans acidivorans TaxID=886464 RepID=A0A317MT77_9GAMM|nr:DsrE family protein [Plasticicumulans acidivorans]PWV60529.1 putative peroxiredoxin [Plasticicumulans acidivorans]
MSDKLLFILTNADPSDAAVLNAVFAQAAVAAAMEYDVEMVLTGRSGALAQRAFANEVSVGKGRSAYDLLRDAAEAGVKFKICTQTQERLTGEMIPEIAEVVGGAYIISEAMDDDTVTFTY